MKSLKKKKKKNPVNLDRPFIIARAIVKSQSIDDSVFGHALYRLPNLAPLRLLFKIQPNDYLSCLFQSKKILYFFFNI